jgi:hypothetical protein
VPALPPPAIVRTVECDTVARTADFQGDMRAIKGASRLQMRFSVQVDPAGADDWQRVQAPNLDQWVSALAGKQRYVYTKHLEGLQTGNGYRVVVKFRWKAADGTTLKTVTHRSHACRLPDPRPNLVPVSIAQVDGGYVVTVANKGRAPAPATSASFDAGDAVLGDRDVPALDPGDRAKVAFAGPACTPGDQLVATVDATGLIDEAIEADDVLMAACNG